MPTQSWNRLTATLSLCNLKQPHAVWAFLVLQGLVRDEPGDREGFVQVAFEQNARWERDPESFAFGSGVVTSVARYLGSAQAILTPGLAADPWGELTIKRLEDTASWPGAAQILSEPLSRQKGRLDLWRWIGAEGRTTAVCLECGTMKTGAWTCCSACGHRPTGVEDRARHMMLSDHFVAAEKLEQMAARRRQGEPWNLDAERLAEFVKRVEAMELPPAGGAANNS